MQPETLAVAEGRLADVALEGLFARVHGRVLLQLIAIDEAGAARLALVLVRDGRDVVPTLMRRKVLAVRAAETAEIAGVQLLDAVHQGAGLVGNAILRGVIQLVLVVVVLVAAAVTAAIAREHHHALLRRDDLLVQMRLIIVRLQMILEVVLADEGFAAERALEDTVWWHDD